MSKRVAIITGASSGIGKQFAIDISKKFSNIDEIWLIARRKERLVELQDEINKPTKIISEDVTSENFCEFYKKMLKQEHPNVRMLVNCAGYGVFGKLEDQSLEVELGMIDTNCKALTNITMLTLKYMKKHSRIINIASVAAFLPQTNFAIYAATKSYVLSFTRALNYELRSKKIYTLAVCPGPVNTEFFYLAESGEKRAWYKDYFMSKVEDVVDKAIRDSIAKKEVSVYSKSMFLLMILSKLLPHKILLTLMNIIN